MKIRLLAAFSAALAAGAMITACSSSSGTVADDCKPASDFSTLEPGTLAVVGPDYPPLFTYEQNTLGGVDGEILKRFAQENCLEVRGSLLPAAGVIEAVKGQQADVAGGGWYPTPERAGVVNQTEPVYADPSAFVGKDPSSDLEDYRGKKIGTTQGYLWVADLQKWAGSNAKLYSSPDAVFQDLLAGRIDVAMMATNEAAYRLAQAPADADLSSVPITPTDAIPSTRLPTVTNFPHTKGNNKLTEALNTYIAKIRKNGTLASILQKSNIDTAYADPS